jgi:hypothetical protein
LSRHTTSAIHADVDLPARKNLDEVGRGGLAALIRVEYLVLAMRGQRLLYRFDAEVGLQRHRHPRGQYAPGTQVHNGGQTDEAPRIGM